MLTIYFFHLPPSSSHLHPLQGENCDSNSRLVVYGHDNGKFRLEKVKCCKPTLGECTYLLAFLLTKLYIAVRIIGRSRSQNQNISGVAHVIR